MKNVFSSVINFLNKIFINNQDYGQGKSIVIRNGRVLIDGIDVTPDKKIITIEVRGDIDSLNAGSANVTVYGNVLSHLQTGSGDVTITGSVAKDVKTSSGDVSVGDSITGNVSTSSGDITVKEIKGSVSTRSGDVSKKFR